MPQQRLEIIKSSLAAHSAHFSRIMPMHVERKSFAESERPKTKCRSRWREGETMFDIAATWMRESSCAQGISFMQRVDPGLIRDFAPGAQTLEGFSSLHV